MVHQEQGSVELKKSLPYGSLTQMADVFGKSREWISKVVSGKHYSKEILEAAIRIAEVSNDKQEEINNILDEYRFTKSID